MKLLAPLCLALLIVVALSSCGKEEGCTDGTALNYNPNSEEDDGSCVYQEGCTDEQALNFSLEAIVDDGSCEYTTVAFYGGQLSPCQPVVVTVDGVEIGSLQDVFYPSRPGNCSVPGIVTYTFPSDIKVDWIGLDQCGTIFSGEVSTTPNDDCIFIRVF